MISVNLEDNVEKSIFTSVLKIYKFIVIRKLLQIYLEKKMCNLSY